jgi:protein SCO1/2
VNPRVRLVIIGVLACGFAAVAGVWLAASRDTGGTAQAARQGFVRPAGARVPDYLLHDQDGHRATPADHAGDTTIYAFVYSTCQDVCPIEVQQIRGALDDLGRDLPVVAVSVDPKTDTPALAKRFMVKQHMTGRMRFLLGTRAQLAPVWKAFGIAPQRDGRDHSAYVIVVDGRGRQRLGYPASALTSAGLAGDLARLRD